MAIIIFLIIIAIIWWVDTASINAKMDNKNPLEVDNTKMIQDKINGVSQREIRRRYGNGYYDKK